MNSRRINNLVSKCSSYNPLSDRVTIPSRSSFSLVRNASDIAAIRSAELSFGPADFIIQKMQFAPLGETALIFGYALVFSLGVNDLAKMALINRRAQPAGEAL